MRRILYVFLTALLGFTLGGAVLPGPAPAAPAAAAAVDWTDDEADWYRSSVVDIATYAAEFEVRDAATAALAAGTTQALADFVDTGWAKSRLTASQRKTREKNQVKTWSTSGGTNVKRTANLALISGDFAISEYVAWGWEVADRLDRPVGDTEAERARIYARVEQMVTIGGPTVVAEGSQALASGDPATIAAFYTTGYAAANKTDWDNRERIRVAVETRNQNIEALTAAADAATGAARARADIVAANIRGLRYLEDALLAMRSAAAAANAADQVFEQDRINRPRQPGRTALLEAHKGEAAAQANRAAQTALDMNQVIAQVQVAAKELTDSGQAHGQDWAQVTLSVGLAAQAAAHAAGTASQAATATLADSLALDADQNATLHANNAARWLTETRYQETVAAQRATVAKTQQKIAEDAAARAKTQRGVAEKAATSAKQHADNAKTLRADAERASSNAVSQAQIASAAQLDANEAVQREQAAINRVDRAGTELEAATSRCIAAEQQYNVITAALQKARDEATQAGQDADAATRDLQIQADRARDAYNAALAWAAKARAAADAARGEAEKASAAATKARNAAKAAQQSAQTARKASDKAGQAAADSVRAAENAEVGARRTQAEAEEAVREAGQAVVQADIAGDAAGSAAALAQMTVDRSGTATYIAARFAAINADARDALSVAAEALTVAEQQAAAAAKRAEEADKAAQHATKQAQDAVDDIKPAYESAARAIGSANTAIAAANQAYQAAIAATNDANGATTAANTATQWESVAWREAMIADNAAQNASLAAASAGRASASIDKAYAWAKSATAGIHTQAKKLADTLKGLQDEKAKQDAILREQQAFEDKVEDGILSYLKCSNYMTDACKHLWELVQPSLKSALDATKNHIALLGKCYTGDDAACDAAQANGDAVQDWFVQVGAGLWEAAKGFVTGLKALADCGSWVVVGLDGDYFRNNCGKTVEGFRQMPGLLKDHPLELIHITEWRENPGKAFGLTLFDVASFAIPGVGELGGALNKTLGGISNLLRLGLTRLPGGIGRIERFTVRVAEGAGEAGKLAKITAIGVRIENGVAKFDDAIALIDNKAYSVGSTTARFDGAVGDLENAVVRLDGGVARIEDNVLTIRDLTLKIEKDVDFPETPRACGLPLAAKRAAAAAAAVRCNGTQPDGSWEYTENGVDLALNQQDNAAVDAAIALAKKNEKLVDPRFTKIVNDVKVKVEDPRFASQRYWDLRLKAADSLKRKMAGHRADNPTVPMEDLLAKIGDNLRYTIEFNHFVYVGGVKAAVGLLKADGFQLVKWKNTWVPPKGMNYKGINSTWRDPQTGQLFEVQFHTPDSFWVNKAEHIYYEIGRLSDDAVGYGLPATEARGISTGLWDTVKPPVGAPDLDFPVG
ncbi:hypothetical protein KOI35_35645 [Actinoplanes bogorensis]|uniref:Methyl-accepting transducer domain-containing protein n=1 Tax=Paractinoplanes bogorensis TaxID=1610840 RepID=A0ABS5YZN8_9ACTN|nr:hypothetical protein [Actinoplanes bogorensis]MBU2668858.1 hypothetical protein [Actinoplanes bogorensis]